ncbi:hypothetical protein IG631_11058 [Alternaria alternata]|nr:hypothetical protein IG631_11058 [Alternaria alternata]
MAKPTNNWRRPAEKQGKRIPFPSRQRVVGPTPNTCAHGAAGNGPTAGLRSCNFPGLTYMELCAELRPSRLSGSLTLRQRIYQGIP